VPRSEADVEIARQALERLRARGAGSPARA
jgi:hypothetical protein